MKNFFYAIAFLILSLQFAIAAMPIWSYDPGPDLKTRMDKVLIDLTASIPNMPEVSDQVVGDQKFRPAFGPVLWHMVQNPNRVLLTALLKWC